MYLLMIIMGICTAANGIAGIILKHVKPATYPLSFTTFHISFHKGNYLDFKKQLHALGALGIGECMPLLIGGITLTLLGFLCRRLPRKIISASPLCSFFKKAALVVLPLILVYFCTPILAKHWLDIENIWQYLWSKGIILHAPAPHKPTYYQAISLVLCSFSGFIYALRCSICTVQLFRKFSFLAWLLLMPLYLIIALGVIWFVYPLIGVIMPALVLAIGLLILYIVFEIGGSMGDSSNGSDRLDRLIEEKNNQEHTAYIQRLENSLHYHNTLSPQEKLDLFDAASKGETEYRSTEEWYKEHAYRRFDYGDSPDDE